jgi:hypothetical protein
MRDAKSGLYDIVPSTTLESNKSQRRNERAFLFTVDGPLFAEVARAVGMRHPVRRG